MNCSLQAAGGRISAPADRAYPFRCVVLERREDGFWRVLCIFEMQTLDAAEVAGMEMCTEPYDAGVTAMHCYVGEVA